MERIIELEGKEIGLKCTAGTVRAYRIEYGRDLIQDMTAIEQQLLEDQMLTQENTGIAENVLYMFAKQYDSNIPSLPEWLDGFSPYFVFSAIGAAIVMWRENLMTLSSAKKNIDQSSESGQQPSSSCEQSK